MINTGLSAQELNTVELVGPLAIVTSGARVVFEGTTRSPSNGRVVPQLKKVSYLEYEAYETLAEKQLENIANFAADKWSLDGIVAVHRTGRVDAGHIGVVVAVTSAHRAEAFEACSWIIDQIKHEVAIWKKECCADGDTHWVGCS